MVTAKFNPETGFLVKTKLVGGSETPTEMSFIHYCARGHGYLKTGGDALSGAYLFLPNGHAKTLSTAENSFVVVDGPIRKSIFVKGPKEILLTRFSIRSPPGPEKLGSVAALLCDSKLESLMVKIFILI